MGSPQGAYYSSWPFSAQLPQPLSSQQGRGENTEPFWTAALELKSPWLAWAVARWLLGAALVTEADGLVGEAASSQWLEVEQAKRVWTGRKVKDGPLSFPEHHGLGCPVLQSMP